MNSSIPTVINSNTFTTNPTAQDSTLDSVSEVTNYVNQENFDIA